MRPALTAICLLALPVVAAPREVIDLSGTWQMARVGDLDASPPRTGWQELEVPSTIGGYDYGAAWFRRGLGIPEAWRGRRVALRFGGVRWNSRVLVNGSPVGGCFNGYDAFELDITGAVRFGEANDLLVGAHDVSGVFDPAQPRVAWSDRGEIRSQPVDRVLAPIGGVVTNFGLWDRCRLVVTDPVHVSATTIRTSVRRGRLSVAVRVANGTADAATVPVRAAVLDAAGAEALRLEETTVTVPPGGGGQAEFEVAWPGARRWSHEDPYLYTLRVSAGGDLLEERFGFRELWCDGGDFYLNGAKVHLLASSWWPANPPYSDDRVRETLTALKAAHTHVFRTHTQPWPENWYTIADEVGVLMIPEAAIWNDDEVYRLDDDRFWGNYRAHLENMVGNLGNHASVVMWSLENEFTGARLNDDTPERVARLAALADAVREADPTRPVTYESDGDPGGRADVIGMHYPNEWPAQYQWPNCADWLSGEAPNRAGGGGFLWPEPTFTWRRDKPLYIGEFLWIPSNNPDASTVWLGDEAYIDYQQARTQAKAMSWVQQILAYRRAELSGMSPWTMAEHGPLDETNPCWRAHRYAYQPIAAFCREADRRFYTGDRVTRTLDVYNDTLAERSLTLTVTPRPTGAAAVRELPRLEPGAHRVETIELAAGAGQTSFRIELAEAGEVVFSDSLPVAVATREPIAAAGSPIGVYDPRGTGLAARLAAAGVATTPVPALDGDLPPRLIVAPDALASGAAGGPVVIGEQGESERLVAYVEQGGRLLVLPQAQLPSGLFGAAGSARESTMAFAGAPEHPILTGVSSDELLHWRGDNLVGLHEPQRPAAGGTVPIIVSGGGGGLQFAPLLEYRRGRGTAILCGMRWLGKLDTEPAARKLLQNTLLYLDAYQPTPGRTVLSCTSETAARELRAVGLRAAALTSPADLDTADVAVLVEPEAALLQAPETARFVRRGGRLLVSHVGPGIEPALGALGIDGLHLRAMPASVTRLEHPSLPGLLREDLFWLGPQEGVGWSPRPRIANQADWVATPELPPGGGDVYQAERMQVDGPVARVEGEHVLLASYGTVTGSIEVAETGDYVLGVRGWGTPLDEVYPMVSVAIDGTRLGEVYLAAREPGTYALSARLADGRHTIALSFTNDRNSATEDRNAFLDSITVARTERPLGMTPLASPAALLEASVGEGLVLLDLVRWDRPQGNAAKARRYLASLLTILGAECRTGGGTVIEGETMRPQPGLAYLGPAADHMRYGQGGWAEVDCEVRRAGVYRLTLVARGDSAAGGWPVAKVLVAGQIVAEVAIDSADWAEFGVRLELPAGPVTVRVLYDNDLYDPPEDRNLMLDRLIVEPDGE